MRLSRNAIKRSAIKVAFAMLAVAGGFAIALMFEVPATASALDIPIDTEMYQSAD